MTMFAGYSLSIDQYNLIFPGFIVADCHSCLGRAALVGLRVFYTVQTAANDLGSTNHWLLTYAPELFWSDWIGWDLKEREHKKEAVCTGNICPQQTVVVVMDVGEGSGGGSSSGGGETRGLGIGCSGGWVCLKLDIEGSFWGWLVQVVEYDMTHFSDDLVCGRKDCQDCLMFPTGWNESV